MNIKFGAGMSKGRVAELLRASHVVALPLAEEDTLDLTTTIADPEMRALLLVEVVDHDLVLDVVQEHGAGAGPRRADRVAGRVHIGRRGLQLKVVGAEGRIALLEYAAGGSGSSTGGRRGSRDRCRSWPLLLLVGLLSLEIASETHLGLRVGSRAKLRPGLLKKKKASVVKTQHCLMNYPKI